MLSSNTQKEHEQPWATSDTNTSSTSTSISLCMLHFLEATQCAFQKIILENTQQPAVGAAVAFCELSSFLEHQAFLLAPAKSTASKHKMIKIGGGQRLIKHLITFTKHLLAPWKLMEHGILSQTLSVVSSMMEIKDLLIKDENYIFLMQVKLSFVLQLGHFILMNQEIHQSNFWNSDSQCLCRTRRIDVRCASWAEHNSFLQV